MGRYAISLIPVKRSLPILTLITNIIGAIAVDFISGIISSKENISQNLILFTKIGICGGFTTFSTFSLEAYDLFTARQYLLGSIYLAFSVAFCIAGISCGKRLSAIIPSI